MVRLKVFKMYDWSPLIFTDIVIFYIDSTIYRTRHIKSTFESYVVHSSSTFIPIPLSASNAPTLHIQRLYFHILLARVLGQSLWVRHSIHSSNACFPSLLINVALILFFIQMCPLELVIHQSPLPHATPATALAVDAAAAISQICIVNTIISSFSFLCVQ